MNKVVLQKMSQELHEIGDRLEKLGDVSYDLIMAKETVPTLTFTVSGFNIAAYGKLSATIYGNHIAESLDMLKSRMLLNAEALMMQKKWEYEIGSGSRDAYLEAQERYEKLQSFWNEKKMEVH